MLTLSDTFNVEDIVNLTSSSIPQVEYNIDPTNIYSCCFKNFLLENKPFILKSSTKNWPCTSNWVASKKPNFEYISTRYGSTKAPVIDCNVSNQSDKYCPIELTIAEYLKYWQNYISSGYDPSESCYYLKDWHFFRDFKSESIYRVPNVFSSDWLNEYFVEYLSHTDDYRFVYMGPKNTWTPTHIDVYSSYSWSVNICGSKQWLLLPQENKHLFKNSLSWSSLPANSYLTVNQEAGDAIFIPSGWYHQVTNLDDTISINHNWINGCNISYVFEELVTQLEAVKEEIADCKDMEDWSAHCQLMLKADYSMDFIMFFDMLKYVCEKRIASLRTGNIIQVNI